MHKSINVMQTNAGGLDDCIPTFGKPNIIVVATDMSGRDRIEIFGLHPSRFQQLGAK